MLDQRVIDELVRIHRPTTTYRGFNETGKAWLGGGGSLGPGPDDLPLAAGMNGYQTCATCKPPDDLTEAWPCETIRLLIEAGVIPNV